MRLMFLSVAAAALSGCATWGQMDDGLRGLVGQPIDAAVAKLGYPNGEQNIAGMKLVVWSSSSSGVMMLPQTARNYGTVNTSRAGFANYSSTTTYSAPVPYNYSCEIKVRVDERSIIQGYDYSGNLGGCSRYINALTKR